MTDCFHSLDTQTKMTRGAVLKRHDAYDASAAAIFEELGEIRQALKEANTRREQEKTARESRINQFDSSRLIRFLRWARLL